MKKKHISDIDRLAFYSAISARVAEQSDLIPKFMSCLANDLFKRDTRIQKSSGNIIYYHSPSRMIEFLRLFSTNDDFKWYTHKWDISIPFDIERQINRQKITKSILRDMAYPKESGPAVNANTYNQVWNFINFLNSGEKLYTWTNSKIEYIREGWHSVINYSRENPTIPIENIKLENGHQFKDYIRMFKAIIEFRTDLKDDDRFSEVIWRCITDGLPKDLELNFNPRFNEIGYDINVYCDVVGVLSAINIICSWITKHKSISSKVTVDLLSDKDAYILEIFHIGSFFNNIAKLEIPSGDLANLRNRLFSVCDFSMEGDYVKDGQQRNSIYVGVLNDGAESINGNLSNCSVSLSSHLIGGVKYKLKIYKRS